MDASVGPIRVEVLEGPRQVRVIVEPNEWGIELDAVYDGFSEAHLESRHFDRQFTRVTFDSTRFAQVGLVDRHARRSATGRWPSPPTGGGGRRDRSWGVRPVGEAEPPGIRVTDTGGGFFWIYAPVRFDDHAMVTIIQERPDGERIMQDAHRVFPVGSGREPEWLGRPEHELRFAPGTRRVTGATLSYFGAHGEKTAEVEVRDLARFPLLLGTGYGLESDWKHGMYQGDLVVQGQQVPPGRPGVQAGGSPSTRPGSPTTGKSATACSSARSWGPIEQYGFSGWELRTSARLHIHRRTRVDATRPDGKGGVPVSATTAAGPCPAPR